MKKLVISLSIALNLLLIVLDGCGVAESRSTPAVNTAVPLSPSKAAGIQEAIQSGQIKTYSDAGTEITASVGEEFAVALDINFRLGSRWYESHEAGMLDFVGEDDEAGKPVPSINTGKQYFLFRALKAGETELVFIRKYAGNNIVQEEKVFIIKITSRDISGPTSQP